MMPEINWWRLGGRCKDFGPDNVDGRLVKGGQFRCRDTPMPEWFGPHWRWTLHGQYAGSSDTIFEDMPKVDVIASGADGILLPPNL